MYYLELIRKFWNFNQKAKLDTTVITVYLYLLNLANDRGSYTISISDRNFSRTLGLSRNSIMAARKKLQSLGIVDYNKDTVGIATYRLVLDYDLEISISETAQIESLLSDVVIPTDEEPIASSSSSTSLASFVSDENQQRIDESELADNISPELAVKGTDQPSLDIFLEYAQTLEGYEPSLAYKITEKYSSWQKNDWKSVSGRPITDWKSSLKSLMPFMKNTSSQDFSLTSISRIKRPK
ncbi:helix-turn-helix domain-containing protein [Chryseobacterium shandongense]|uniref:helix-turn-helix domain-containing protein n=1 Tax=Chryseobacterium shandongense TaxID=1493872 RepID=UPI000F4D7323|nr:helix-turn-helix domain-containing protein [Chryseobacterium shandongense]AZA56334.1 hypothetical protein EG350_03630 [Chryseobacterium shandongense]